MGKGFLHGNGGSNPLNFDVVRYSTQAELLAAKPSKYTIGIISANAMTGWSFVASDPTTLVEGMVYITTGTSSDIEFNALKKNEINLYPIAAQQCVGGALVLLDAYSYYEGTSWVQFSSTEVYLFNNGDKCTSVTGGWTTKKDSSISVSVGSSTITFSYSSGSGRSAAAYTTNKIDTSKYTTMVVTGNMTAVDASEEERGFMFGLTSSNTSSDPSTWVTNKTLDSKGTFELTLDISNANSSYYACVYAHGSKVEVYTVLLK